VATTGMTAEAKHGWTKRHMWPARRSRPRDSNVPPRAIRRVHCVNKPQRTQGLLAKLGEHMKRMLAIISLVTCSSISLADTVTDQEIRRSFQFETQESGDVVFRRITREDHTVTRSIHVHEFVLKIGPQTRQYMRSYPAAAHILIYEEGNCGAFGCNLKCTVEISRVKLVRELYLRDSAGKYELVSSKNWGGGDFNVSHDKNCNEFVRDNRPGVLDRALGTFALWKSHIEQDFKDIQREIGGQP